MHDDDNSNPMPKPDLESITATGDAPSPVPDFTDDVLPVPPAVPTPAADVWLPRREAARRINQSERTVRRLEKAGKVRAIRDPRGRSLYLEADIDAYAKKRGAAPVAPAAPAADTSALQAVIDDLVTHVGGLLTMVKANQAEAATVHGQWRALAPGIVLTPDDLRRIEAVLGKPPTRAFIVDMCTTGVEALRKYVADERARAAGEPEK